MRLSKLLTILLIGIVIGITACVGVYFLTQNDIAWQEYIDTKVIPNVVLALSTISALCVAAMPIITKIKATLTSFDKATQDVNGTAQSGKNTIENVLKCKEDIQAIMDEFTLAKTEMQEALTQMQNGINNIETISRIGFGNTSELVKNGYARQIAEVGQDDTQETEI